MVSGLNAASAAYCAGVDGDEEVLCEFLDVAHEAFGNDHPAEAPASHLEILRKLWMTKMSSPAANAVGASLS